MIMPQWWQKLKPWCLPFTRREPNHWVPFQSSQRRSQSQKLKREKSSWIMKLMLLLSPHCLQGKGYLMLLMSIAVGHPSWLTDPYTVVPFKELAPHDLSILSKNFTGNGDCKNMESFCLEQAQLALYREDKNNMIYLPQEPVFYIQVLFFLQGKFPEVVWDAVDGQTSCAILQSYSIILEPFTALLQFGT